MANLGNQFYTLREMEPLEKNYIYPIGSWACVAHFLDYWLI